MSETSEVNELGQSSTSHKVEHREYRIATPGVLGGVEFNLTLSIHPKTGTVSGFGEVSHPSVHLDKPHFTKLNGDATPLCVMGESECNNLIVATGYPVMPGSWDPRFGPGPVLLPNVELRLLVNSQYDGIVATYTYYTEDHTPVQMENIPVQTI